MQDENDKNNRQTETNNSNESGNTNNRNRGNRNVQSTRSHVSFQAPADKGSLATTYSTRTVHGRQHTEQREHCHRHRIPHTVDTRARRKLIFGCCLCSAVMVGEMVGGIYSNSLALISDAVHRLVDVASYLIAIWSINLAARDHNASFSFGMHRAEVICAILTISVTWMVCGVLCYLALKRCADPDFTVRSDIMLITAAVAICLNILLIFKFCNCSMRSAYKNEADVIEQLRLNEKLPDGSIILPRPVRSSPYQRVNTPNTSALRIEEQRTALAFGNELLARFNDNVSNNMKSITSHKPSRSLLFDDVDSSDSLPSHSEDQQQQTRLVVSTTSKSSKSNQNFSNVESSISELMSIVSPMRSNEGVLTKNVIPERMSLTSHESEVLTSTQRYRTLQPQKIQQNVVKEIEISTDDSEDELKIQKNTRLVAEYKPEISSSSEDPDNERPTTSAKAKIRPPRFSFGFKFAESKDNHLPAGTSFNRYKIAHSSGTTVPLQGSLSAATPPPSPTNGQTTAKIYDPHNASLFSLSVHIAGDLLQTIFILIAAIILFYYPKAVIVDPVCTFVFVVIVLTTSLIVLKDLVLVLMETTPSYMDYKEVLRLFHAIEGVMHVHSLRIWNLSPGRVALLVHIAVAPNVDPIKMLRIACIVVHQYYEFYETTIQVEDYMPIMETCIQCKNPE